MGLMDRAKKMAEQAQAKLDEVQKEFNSSQQSSPSGPVVEYDKHGRPIGEQPAAPPEPHGDPTAAAAAAAPPPTPPAPPAPPVPPAPPQPSATDDPYAPPKLSSGDPLAGG
jgi:hypothetical protein